ncbi:MAG: hypothetical protein Harvfovirus1_3 [Harvfovirus sp.]|uniref:Ankyrin repeat protein n=1 Tax=Harvfovirus sp. TaxID=2487768 RepID=A0A3G4ZZN8_9VIRU|nr:MAG: hypothetical protein Harvfovirus1_3 [Harvfovirus sp.]
MEIFEPPFSKEQDFVYFCLEGKLSEAKQLVATSSVDINLNRDEPFRICCMQGHFEMAKWIYSFGTVDIHSIDESAFRMSCFRNYSDIAKWLYSIGEININILSDSAFYLSCVNGNLDIAKWLYSLGVSLDALDLIFCDTCKDNHLTMIEWLFGLSNGRVLSYDKAFENACLKNYLEVCQCIYKLSQGKVDIHKDDDIYFITSVHYQNIKMINWLLTIATFSRECIDRASSYFHRETFQILYQQRYPITNTYMENAFKYCRIKKINYYKRLILCVGIFVRLFNHTCEVRYGLGGKGFYEAMDNFLSAIS